MLVGLCGSFYSGRSTIVDYLVSKHNFRVLSLRDNSAQWQSSTQEEDIVGANAETIKAGPGHGAGTNGVGQAQVMRFMNFAVLVDFVTRRWQERWVLPNINGTEQMESLRGKPFFLLISVDAPLMTRWARYSSRPLPARWHVEGAASELDLESFASLSDDELYEARDNKFAIMHNADLHILNSFASVEKLHEALDILDIPNHARLRPSWDQYFMSLASLAAKRSNCMKRRVGAVIVRDKRVISTGYNGTPRGIRNCNDGGCPRCNAAGATGGARLDTCLCIHAEENALIEAGRERIRERSILYCDTCPCLTCSIKIAQVGISEVVYHRGYHMDANVSPNVDKIMLKGRSALLWRRTSRRRLTLRKTAAVFRESGVTLRQFVPAQTFFHHLRVGMNTMLSFGGVMDSASLVESHPNQVAA